MHSRTITVIRLASMLIMLNAAIVSYTHQRTLLLAWSADLYTATATPLSVDLLSIVAIATVHADRIHPAARRTALQTLAVAVLVSAAANWCEGGSLVTKLANVFVVAAILLSERVAAKAKQTPPTVDEKRSEAAKRGHVTRKANTATKPKPRRRRTPVQQIEALTNAAPVSPAPAGR
jgi:hypothetical protein